MKNLLLICHSYETFVKNPTEILAKNFDRINVLVRYNPLSELANIVPHPWFKSRMTFTKKYLIDLTALPDNISVFPTPMWYLPLESSYKRLGERHANASLAAIKKHHLKFDLIHAHFGWTAGFVATRLKEVYQTPCIVTGHGYDVYDYPFRDDDWRQKLSAVYNKADEVTTVSKNNIRCMQEMGVKKDVHLIPNGFSEKMFYFKSKEECREKLGLPADKKIILTIGNLEPVKGYEHLLKAIKIMSAQREDFLCIHIGSGQLQSALSRLIQDSGISNFVKLLGRKPHHELVDWYGACDFFVSSSLAEGNPTVLFEALGCGKPFIGTKVGGVPDIVTNAQLGLLANAGDENALAENLLKAMTIEWNTNFILDHARQFTWEKIAQKYWHIYSRYLKG